MNFFEFKSLQDPVQNILVKEKGSKFLGFAYPVNSEIDLKISLENIKQLHPKATHHCYAFRLGINGENYRANDDGEPSGSAGLPIFNQILAHGITNVVVVVVRYYGGTKLGVSGLVKAYKETAKLTLDAAIIITKERETHLEIKFDFPAQNAVFSVVNRAAAKTVNFSAGETCVLQVSVGASQTEKISAQLAEIKGVSLKFSED